MLRANAAGTLPMVMAVTGGATRGFEEPAVRSPPWRRVPRAGRVYEPRLRATRVSEPLPLPSRDLGPSRRACWRCCRAPGRPARSRPSTRASPSRASPTPRLAPAPHRRDPSVRRKESRRAAPRLTRSRTHATRRQVARGAERGAAGVCRPAPRTRAALPGARDLPGRRGRVGPALRLGRRRRALGRRRPPPPPPPFLVLTGHVSSLPSY